MSSVPVASGVINSRMEKWFGLSIQSSIHQMNNLIVKYDLDSIMKCVFGLWTKSICSLFLFVVFNSILLPFSYRLRLRFSLPLIKITARIDRPQKQRNWLRPRIETTNHRTYTDLSLTIVFSKRSGLLHWLLTAKKKKKKKQNSEVELWKVWFFKQQ